jgi:hypothetical protein
MSYELFWYGDAETYWAYQTAFINKERYEQEKENRISWLRGLYIYDALTASNNNANRTKDSDRISNYMNTPIDWEKMTQDEIKKTRQARLEQDMKAYMRSKQRVLEKKKKEEK